MSESWCREYVLLALRIEKVFSLLSDLPFVDVYYGPPAWKQVVEQEPAMEAADLVRSAIKLADSLSAQNFDPQRRLYLEKQVGALEMICRLLGGETFSLEEELQRCLDITPTWILRGEIECSALNHLISVHMRKGRKKALVLSANSLLAPIPTI